MMCTCAPVPLQSHVPLPHAGNYAQYNPGAGAICEGEDWVADNSISGIQVATAHLYERQIETEQQRGGRKVRACTLEACHASHAAQDKQQQQQRPFSPQASIKCMTAGSTSMP